MQSESKRDEAPNSEVPSGVTEEGERERQQFLEYIETKRNKVSRPEMPPGLTEEAERNRQLYLRDVEEMLEPDRQTSLNILVWGPNTTSTSPVAQKRIEIRDALQELGHNAMFSEDLPRKPDVSEKFYEFRQAQKAHLIIALIEEAPGALAETHDFCNHPEIAHKYYVLVPNAYKEGYSSRGAIQLLADGYGGVYWYDEVEITSCNLLSTAVKRAEARRHILTMWRVNGGLE